MNKPVEVIAMDTGRVEAIIEAVTETLETHRPEILVAPKLSTVTLIVRLDRGPKPDVLFRTESR